MRKVHIGLFGLFDPYSTPSGVTVVGVVGPLLAPQRPHTNVLSSSFRNLCAAAEKPIYGFFASDGRHKARKNPHLKLKA
jgi:hypothetical protein